MTLRESAQEGLPARVVVQLLKGALDIPKRQEQQLRPGFRQPIPDLKGLWHLPLSQENAAQVERGLEAIGVGRQGGAQVRGAVAEVPRHPSRLALLGQQSGEGTTVRRFAPLQ